MHGNSAPLVTKAEAARLTGYSISTIRRLVDRGVLREVIPAPGMRPRVPLDAVLSLARPPEEAP